MMRKVLIVLLFLMSLGVVNAVAPFGVSDVSFDVVNVSDGEHFKDKATELAGGDSVI